MRLDQALAQQHTLSRNKAAELIQSGAVFVDSKRVTKPAYPVDPDAPITLSGSVPYVSRSARKLEGFLDQSGLDVSKRACLDIGSSTGGFVQVLLQSGAASVTAVDVGLNQLHPSLRDDPRIKLHEQTDIRNFHPGERFSFITCDVSFVSLEHLIEPIDRLASGVIVLLFKPQFEVGRAAKRDRSGVVRDRAAIEAAMARFEARCIEQGWTLTHKAPASITGKSGNQEIFYGYQHV